MKLSRKRLMAALFAILMMITTMLPLGSAAASITMDLSVAEVSWDATLKDADGNVFSAAYGLKAADNPFGYAIGTYVKKMHDYTAKSPNAPAKKSDWVYGRDYIYCFCIEHGIALPNSNSYSGSTDETHGNKYELLSIEQKNLLSLALAYGYPNRTDLETSKDANACYSATQLIIWQITFGFRTSPTELNDKTYPASGYSGTMTEQFTSNPYLKEYYDLILSDMATHYMRPSFTTNVPMAAPTYEMDYVNGKYTVTLTDTNQVLSKFKVTASGGATVSINGNQMTISSVQPLNNTVTIKLNRRMPTTTHTTGFLIWSVQGSEESNQDMVSGVPANNDPVPSYLRVATAPGSIHIEKDSEDGKVDGVSFRIVGNGVDQIVETANEGSCLVNDLRPGTYTVTELTEDQYEETIPQTVTVTSNETTTVVFQNVLKRGTLKILKTSEDDKVDNVLFTINGNGVNEKVYTNEVGEIMIPDLLPGKYTVTEQNADYYEPLESQIVIAIGILSGITYGCYSLLTKTALKKGYSPLSPVLYGSLLMGLLALPTVEGRVTANAVAQNPLIVLLLLLGLGVMTFVLPFFLYGKGLQGLSAGTASTLSIIEPMAATLLSVVVLHDSIGLLQFIGIVLILLSVILLGKADK